MKKEKKSLLKYKLKLLTKEIDRTRDMLEKSKMICNKYPDSFAYLICKRNDAQLLDKLETEYLELLEKIK